MLNLIFDYINDGGMVSYALIIIFIVITYTIGFRISILFQGRNISVRHLYNGEITAPNTVQSEFLAKLRKLKVSKSDELKNNTEWLLIDTFQEIHKFSSVLNTAVLLAPLLGLLGTVIGMIETFASLSNTELFSSSGGIAGGISQALITTQLGLMVAIPGVFLSRYLKKVEKKTLMDIHQLKDLLLLEIKENK